uniref:Uncharacterized protein n=1 Tax=Amphimedon queenslandica TaxID=400682 RepID=A0A1X7UEI2_AMPQE
MAAFMHIVYKSLLLLLMASPLMADKENVPVYEENPSNTWGKIGEEKVEQIRREAQHSTCWKEALVSLETSCKNLSDTSQSRLALSFANCHLERSGRRTYPCIGGQSIRDCTSPNVMDNFAFQTYTEFFTHSSHMCFYLQSTLWRERTERTINDLGKTSTEVVSKLEESLEYHKKMETLQSTSLSNQRDILSHEQKIASSIQAGHTRFSNYFEEMIEKAEKQKLLLDSIFSNLNKGFDGIQWFLTSILGEVTYFGTILFFFLTLIVLTLLPQFGYSRLWLYVTLFFYFILESGIRQIFIWLFGLQSPQMMVS